MNEQARRRLGNEQEQIAGSFSIKPFERSRWSAGRARLLDNSARSEEARLGAARGRSVCPTLSKWHGGKDVRYRNRNEKASHIIATGGAGSSGLPALRSGINIMTSARPIMTTIPIA